MTTSFPPAAGPVGLIAGLFAGPGARDYAGEAVSLAAHMLLAAGLAEAAAAPGPLVAAALLHDIGHLCGPPAGAVADRDSGHGVAGAGWLRPWFPCEVTEPVRLHVAAKRYLCATAPGYTATLSAESARTLALQGGPMTRAEAAAFEALPHAEAALAVRGWDERAKDPRAPVPAFEHFRPLLARLAAAGAGPS